MFLLLLIDVIVLSRRGSSLGSSADHSEFDQVHFFLLLRPALAEELVAYWNSSVHYSVPIYIHLLIIFNNSNMGVSKSKPNQVKSE